MYTDYIDFVTNYLIDKWNEMIHFLAKKKNEMIH